MAGRLSRFEALLPHTSTMFENQLEGDVLEERVLGRTKDSRQAFLLVFGDGESLFRRQQSNAVAELAGGPSLCVVEISAFHQIPVDRRQEQQRTRISGMDNEYCCDKNSRVADLLVAYAAIELYERRLKLMLQTYEKALAAYKTEIFTFVVPGAKQAQLQFLNPVLQNRMKDFKASVTKTAE